jgi:hypothetical protein
MFWHPQQLMNLAGMGAVSELHRAILLSAGDGECSLRRRRPIQFNRAKPCIRSYSEIYARSDNAASRPLQMEADQTGGESHNGVFPSIGFMG